MRELLRVLVISAGVLSCPFAWSSNLIEINPLQSRPTLDGDASEWQQWPVNHIALHPNSAPGRGVNSTKEVAVRAGYLDGEVFFILEWDDAHEDRLHKPFVWDDGKQKYLSGPQREDRLALQFAISGDYSADWFSSQGFVADMWHWKASRSDPLGLADDKKTTVSRDRLLRSARLQGSNGEQIYVLRQWDQGDQLYSTKRYRAYDGDLLPKYILNQGVKRGSTTDIKAASRWHQGRWCLELRRKLDTGYDDDVAFNPGTEVVGAVAIFNRSESPDHSISETLRFRLLP